MTIEELVDLNGAVVVAVHSREHEGQPGYASSGEEIQHCTVLLRANVAIAVGVKRFEHLFERRARVAVHLWELPLPPGA